MRAHWIKNFNTSISTNIHLLHFDNSNSKMDTSVAWQLEVRLFETKNYKQAWSEL